MAKISIIPWIVKKLKRCIGIVEDTDTASQAIASNKYVIWKGDVCKSTSAIYEGDTLSSSNLSAVNGGVGNDLLQDIENKILYEEIGSIMPDESISAGTIGTRGAQKSISYNLPSGYKIIGVTITYISTSNWVIPYVFTSSDAMYANWYRCISSEIPRVNCAFGIRIAYAKATSI